jgi:hypothetical protein
MAELLHEYWENVDGSREFGVVSARSDLLRPTLTPHARRVFSLSASSWGQAMQVYHERLGYGDYRPIREGRPDRFYTEREAAEQEAYLRLRNIR